jgi:predicted lipoprotein with Yx(FWY)xxD motif
VTQEAPAAKGATVDVRKSKLGTMLVDSSGRSLYLFEADKGPSSTCSGSCAAAWPPLTTSGAPKAGGGVKQALLGTTKRKDGSTEVTYHGHPLYYYAGDSAPGATTGQALDQFGAEWYVLAPSGNKIDKDS